MARRKRARRALPASFLDRTTKSGIRKTFKGKKPRGVIGEMPGDNFSPDLILTGRKKRKKKK